MPKRNIEVCTIQKGLEIDRTQDSLLGLETSLLVCVDVYDYQVE